jgi:ribose 1,5-bisphosphate isomerase
MNVATVRAALPSAETGAFDDIVEYRVLGASKHIDMIGRMFGAIAEDGARNGESAAEMLDRVALVAGFFTATRGKASSAVANAILDMTRGHAALRGLDAAEAGRKVIAALERFRADAAEAQEKLVGYILNAMDGKRVVMAFDYSSTVAKFLAKTKAETVFIPESRTINGGRNFIEPCLKSGCKIHFIPDAAMLHYIRECGAALIGVETFYPDGTAFNTTGSDILGMACKQLGVPFYATTTLNKLDWRGAYGTMKAPVMLDAREKMREPLNGLDVSGVDFITPELLPVPPEHITAFITEQGIIPAAQMYGVCRAITEARNEKGV